MAVLKIVRISSKDGHVRLQKHATSVDRIGTFIVGLITITGSMLDVQSKNAYISKEILYVMKYVMTVSLLGQKLAMTELTIPHQTIQKITTKAGAAYLKMNPKTIKSPHVKIGHRVGIVQLKNLEVKLLTPQTLKLFARRFAEMGSGQVKKLAMMDILTKSE